MTNNTNLIKEITWSMIIAIQVVVVKEELTITLQNVKIKNLAYKKNILNKQNTLIKYISHLLKKNMIQFYAVNIGGIKIGHLLQLNKNNKQLIYVIFIVHIHFIITHRKAFVRKKHGMKESTKLFANMKRSLIKFRLLLWLITQDLWAPIFKKLKNLFRKQ